MDKNTGFINWWLSVNAAFSSCTTNNDVINSVSLEVNKLGFDNFAYGKKQAVPFSRSKVCVYGTYPEAWLKRYQDKHYCQQDPSIASRASDRQFVIWQDDHNIKTHFIFKEAREWGINIGATLTLRSMDHSLCMLGVSRSNVLINSDDKLMLKLKMRCLIELIEENSVKEKSDLLCQNEINLNNREEEILRWIADGKCSNAISDILGISENTVNYHIKNIQKKFGSTNRTLAAAYSAALGII
ncbi:autoinducer binding domain-containing protein [Photobacterium sp. WH24]|uniref:autoinducer binding domain-containing protein n=1 Tax=Photobacterium sp. WH24 TaxID=2827237 RepID=UPI001C482435|nr:autoinducer binding domain-containing protein [Photobacterium sp. WH24]MBV7261074.1 autoinducer binding domain-containing protein [Photobacterium sp. WH24]